MIRIALPAAFCAALVTAGCATVEDRIADFRHLSCAELNQKIGKYRHIREEAQRDGLVADVVSVVGNKKERKEAAIDGLASDFKEDGAETDLEALRIVKRDKDCE